MRILLGLVPALIAGCGEADPDRGPAHPSTSPVETPTPTTRPTEPIAVWASIGVARATVPEGGAETRVLGVFLDEDPLHDELALCLLEGVCLEDDARAAEGWVGLTPNARSPSTLSAISVGDRITVGDWSVMGASDRLLWTYPLNAGVESAPEVGSVPVSVPAGVVDLPTLELHLPEPLDLTEPQVASHYTARDHDVVPLRWTPRGASSLRLTLDREGHRLHLEVPDSGAFDLDLDDVALGTQHGEIDLTLKRVARDHVVVGDVSVELVSEATAAATLDYWFVGERAERDAMATCDPETAPITEGRWWIWPGDGSAVVLPVAVPPYGTLSVEATLVGADAVLSLSESCDGPAIATEDASGQGEPEFVSLFNAAPYPVVRAIVIDAAAAVDGPTELDVAISTL